MKNITQPANIIAYVVLTGLCGACNDRSTVAGCQIKEDN